MTTIQILPPLPSFQEALRKNPFRPEESDAEFYTAFDFWGTGKGSVSEEARRILSKVVCACGCGEPKNIAQVRGNCVSSEFSIAYWCGAEGYLFLEEYGREYSFSCSIKLT